EDLPLETADGRLIYSEFVSFVYDVDGKNVMQCNIRDITERKLAEEALHESEDKYRSLVSNIPGIVYRCTNDSDWTMHYISEEIEQVSDYPASDFINNAVRSYASIIHPDDRDLVDRSVQKGLTEKAIFSMEYRICRADGSIRWVHEQGQGVFAHDGNLLWMDGVILDQTERKTVEEALAVSEIKYRTLFDNSSDAILIHDMTGRILDVNQVLCDRLGYSRHELLQMTPLDFDSPEYAELVTERIGQLMRNKHQMFETCNVRKDGTRIPTEINLRIIEYEGQQACLCVGRDITERKMGEVAIRLANKKLALLSSITRHDINNQLTVVMGYLSILEKEQPDPTLNNYFVKVSNAAQRISSMIQFASEYEKIGVSAPVWQDPRTLVDTAAKDVLFGKVIVRNDLHAGMEVFADPLIVKVCYNLMDNAVRYGKKITTIRFSYEEAGEDHLIVCENDGDGIVAEEKEKIFERGFGKNTGLGLFLSREILSITGITLRETGEPGKGARFEMMVPKEAWRFTQKN
ncbi:MAG: PAS domain S-box protein, partial [Methanomicrobiales archaeon]